MNSKQVFRRTYETVSLNEMGADSSTWPIHGMPLSRACCFVRMGRLFKANTEFATQGHILRVMTSFLRRQLTISLAASTFVGAIGRNFATYGTEFFLNLYSKIYGSLDSGSQNNPMSHAWDENKASLFSIIFW